MWLELKEYFSGTLTELKAVRDFFGVITIVKLSWEFMSKPWQPMMSSCGLAWAFIFWRAVSNFLFCLVTLLQMKVYEQCSGTLCCCLVTSSCLIVSDPMDCSPPGSSVHWISQARILEQVAISFSRGSSQPRDGTCLSCLAGGFFTTEPPGKVSGTLLYFQYILPLNDGEEATQLS